MEERNIIKVIHDEIVAKKEWVKKITDMTRAKEVENAGVMFVNNPVRYGLEGETQVQVFKGIENIAAELRVGVSTKKESLETARHTDIRKSFTINGIEYFQLETSQELWEKEMREYKENRRRQENEKNGKQSI